MNSASSLSRGLYPTEVTHLLRYGQLEINVLGQQTNRHTYAEKLGSVIFSQGPNLYRWNHRLGVVKALLIISYAPGTEILAGADLYGKKDFCIIRKKDCIIYLDRFENDGGKRIEECSMEIPQDMHSFALTASTLVNAIDDRSVHITAIKANQLFVYKIAHKRFVGPPVTYELSTLPQYIAFAGEKWALTYDAVVLASSTGTFFRYPLQTQQNVSHFGKQKLSLSQGVKEIDYPDGVHFTDSVVVLDSNGCIHLGEIDTDSGSIEATEHPVIRSQDPKDPYRSVSIHPHDGYIFFAARKHTIEVWKKDFSGDFDDAQFRQILAPYTVKIVETEKCLNENEEIQRIEYFTMAESHAVLVLYVQNQETKKMSVLSVTCDYQHQWENLEVHYMNIKQIFPVE